MLKPISMFTLKFGRKMRWLLFYKTIFKNNFLIIVLTCFSEENMENIFYLLSDIISVF